MTLAALTFGVPPSMDEARHRELLVPFAAYLSRAVGLPVVPYRALGYDDLEQSIRRGAVHVAWAPPTLFALLERDLGCRGLVAGSRGSGEGYWATFVARVDSGVERLEDVRGRSVAWVDPGSASGYLFQRWQLASFGIDPRHAFRSEMFARSHSAVVRAVVRGDAEVGATFLNYDRVDPMRLASAGWIPPPEDTDVSVLRHLPPFGPIPPDAVIATPAVPAEIDGALALAFRAIEGSSIGPSARELFGCTKFAKFEPERYEPLRRALSRGSGLGVRAPA